MPQQYPLGEFSAEHFLEEYWQRKPLLIRQAMPSFTPPLAADELAGLAGDPDIESRIISGHPDREPWRLRHGPFDQEDFATLGNRDWTLLVQAVDHYVPAVALLRQQFRFVPNWRLDDVMVSFAAPGGSVGPHFDQYDVFLLQGEGRRQWQVGERCHAHSPLQAHPELRLLSHFNTQLSYTLHPGDMLYLPPGFAHWGIALDPCTTFSIGFRAPSHADIISHYCDYVLQGLDDDQRYGDANLALQNNPGWISDDISDQLMQIMTPLVNRERIMEWFAGYMTEPKYPADLELNITTPRDHSVRSNTPLHLNPASRSAYRTQDGQLLLYVDGICYPPDAATTALFENTASPADNPPQAPDHWHKFVHTLCAEQQIDYVLLTELCQDNGVRAVIERLIEQGAAAYDTG